MTIYAYPRHISGYLGMTANLGCFFVFKNMKVLIGTPVNKVKEYSIKEWLNAISKLDWENYFLYIVDNSDDDTFCQELDTYCKEANITNYKIDYVPDMKGKDLEEKLVPSREKIREFMLNDDYDIWFSLECDVICPLETLNVLTTYLKGFDVVNHFYPDRENPTQEMGGLGCTLVKRQVLERLSFTEGGGYGYCEQEEPNCYHGGDGFLMRRILKNKFKIVEFHNLLDLEHLGK